MGRKSIPKANRKFVGKIYSCHGTYKRKSDAKAYAKLGRKKGLKIRVVKWRDRWAVYVR